MRIIIFPVRKNIEKIHTHTSVVKEGRKRFIVLFIRSVLKSL